MAVNTSVPSPKARYVLITPAHNEERFLARTAESVIAQTVRPLRWVVVNDGSTDRTAEIVGQFGAQFSFIKLSNRDRTPGRHFGHKVEAFNRGLAEVRNLDFDFIGNLDADITLEPTYYETILREFERDPELGIAGGMVHTRAGERYVSQAVALDSVAGAVQLFRRECFEEVGGYKALPLGGIDAAAEVSARMHGWKTRTFPQYRALEHRFTGSATARPFSSRLKEGRRMYALGYSCLFFGCRCACRALERPWIVGSLVAYFGFFESMFRRRPVLLPPEVVRFLRAEQHGKLKRLLRLPRAA